MQRQLQNRGGMTVGSIRQKYGLGSLVGREKFGLGSDFQDFKDKALGKVRKLIPNELADIAVKAAPFVAPFQPGIAAAMRGIGRFDQRGSISDALKQGALTYGFGRGARYLGGAEGASGGLDSYSMDNLRSGPLGNFIPGGGEKPILTKEQLAKEATKDKSGILSEKILDTTVRKIPLVDKLPKIVQEQLLVGGITAGASVLASYLQGDFREQEPGETMEDYLAERREVVGGQMRTYMDNYYKFDKEYSSKTDEQKDQFVAKYNFATGGRVGFAEGTKDKGGIKSVEVPKKFLVDRLEVTVQPGESDQMAILNAMFNDTGDVMPEDRKQEFYRLYLPQLAERGEISLEKYQFLREELFKEKPLKKAKGGMMSIPVRQNASGVKELDYRASGGFVPVGIKEKADDVPAMLSKNEFVMTADAVRAAGGGSIEKGAQKMYNTMKQLEGRIT